MMSLAPFPDYKSYVKREDKTANVTSEKLKEEMRLYERHFNMFMETIDCVTKSVEKKSPDSLGKNSVLFILPRIVQSIESIRLLSVIGHYYDSAIIERSFLESLGLCAHLSSNEDEAKLWLHRKKIRLPAIELLNLTRWLHLEKEDPRYKALYGELSNYVHGNVAGVAKLIRRYDRKERSLGFQYAPVFNKSGAKGIAVFPLLATHILEIIFNEELKRYKKRREKSMRLAAQYLNLRP